MSVTVAELQDNLTKYIKLSEREDVYITDGNTIIAKLSNPNQERIDIAKSLFGVISGDITQEEAREERLSKIWKF